MSGHIAYYTFLNEDQMFRQPNLFLKSTSRGFHHTRERIYRFWQHSMLLYVAEKKRLKLRERKKERKMKEVVFP